MAVLAFDTLKLAEKLAASGFTAEQAKGAAIALSETMGEYLVTKDHFDRTMAEFELKLLTRIGAMFGATIAILVALDKLL